MKRRLTSLLLAALMAMSATAAFAEPVVTPESSVYIVTPELSANDPILATVGEETILKSEVDAVIPAFLENGYIADSSDYTTVVNAMAQNIVLGKKMEDMGFTEFTQEENDAFLAEAQAMWDDYVNSYADYNQSEDTEEARLAAIAQVEAQLAASGMTPEAVAGRMSKDASQDKMNDYMLAGYVPTDEEVNAVFETYGSIYRQQYEGNVGQYEFAVMYQGQESWFTPEGYRGIIHILLTPDADLLANYQALSAAFEEQQAASETEATQPDATEETAAPQQSKALAAEPTTEPVPVTAGMLEEARQAVLASRQADIDAIFARLAADESFEALIAEYGQDPGMGDPDNLQKGYQVHAQSIIYDPVFTAAAFSDKMQAPGDVSDPVVGSYGIHILRYLRDWESGLVMTDTIKVEITEFLTGQKLNQAYAAAFPAWMEQAGVILNGEAIAQATAQAQQTAVSPEEIAPEALPEMTEAPVETAPEVTAAP